MAILAVVLICATGAFVVADDSAGAAGQQDQTAGPGPRARWPTDPPARVCGQRILERGPGTPPEGATVVPAGDNSALELTLRAANHTFWFAAGTHTLGNDEYGQIIAGDGSTYVGAPGAVLDGQGINRYAITGSGRHVAIRYLTIRNFVAPRDEGVVNHGGGADWLVEYNTITGNKGAGAMIGAAGSTYRYNCISGNGQYGINSCCGDRNNPVEHLTIDHNEIAGNNTDDWESRLNGCGCTGGAKFWINNSVAVTNNWFHDNRGPGLWLDNNNTGFVIEGNYIDDNDGEAVILEAGYDALVRYNNFKNNALAYGRKFQRRDDMFPTGAIYISEDGSPPGYHLKTSPTQISYNNFENNWGGVEMWENANRYCASSAHTHPPYCTVKVNLYSDAACRSNVKDVIPESIGDKYRCRWSTEENMVEHNRFVIDKKAIGDGCAGADFCGVNGIFSNVGTYPEFAGYAIPWRITFEQGNVLRYNEYVGDWKFAGFETSTPDHRRVTWRAWTAPAPPIPETFANDNRPTTFGQDQGSTYNSTDN